MGSKEVTSAVLVKPRSPELFESDLPEERLNHYLRQGVVAIDTETRGLIIPRDRLCLVQICDPEGVVSFVRFPKPGELPLKGDSNLKKLLENDKVVKLFHYARFDVAVMKYYLNADTNNIWCTKIASKLVRTYTDKHSLKYLVLELLGIELDKSNQMSDWSREDLSPAQMEYAANDVRLLIPLKELLEVTLKREGRLELALNLFKALPHICQLDLLGFQNIFDH